VHKFNFLRDNFNLDLLVEKGILEALVRQGEERRREAAQQGVGEEGEHRGRVDISIASHLHRKETLIVESKITKM